MKRKLLSMVVVAVVTIVAGYNVYISQNESKLSDLALANIDALAGGETDASGGRTPEYSWTSDEETHWEGEGLVTTYSSHIGCLNINSDRCYSGVTTMRNRDCPN